MKLLKGLPINPAVLKGVPAVLRQPQWVAAIVSVGFHGALFAVGPSFSTLQGMAQESPEFGQDIERRVPMIELTPEEQSRLPDFDSPAYSLLPDGFLSGDSNNLANLFPPSGDRLSSPSFTPLPGGLSSVPRLPTSQSPLGAPLAVSPFPSRLGRNSIVIPPPSGSRLPRPDPDNPEGISAEDEGNNTAASTPTATTSPPREPSAADLRPREGERATEDTSASLDDRDPSEEVPPEVARSQDLIARVEYSRDLTTADEAERALASWTSTVAEQLDEDPVLAEDTFAVEVPYDLRICLTPEPGDGLLGFVLLPGEEADTVTISTTVLKSTGYSFLNQSAAQTLQTLAANSETPLAMGTLYRAVVKVLYSDDDCVTTDSILKRAEDEATPPPPNEAPSESEESSGAE
ncbi:MAG: hypothetical protein ACHWZW_08690 [Spirulina sp.]